MNYYETEELNRAIRGIDSYRKCPNCDANGIELQSYDASGDPCGSECNTAMRFPCEDCNQLGFIKIPND
jgi:hypothetical protein